MLGCFRLVVYYVAIACRTYTIRLIALLHLLLPHYFTLCRHPLVLRTIANNAFSISSQPQLLAQLAFNGLEAAHFPVLLLLVLALLRD